MSYRIIAIERQYASGGKIVGSKVAQKLGIKCYNEEILNIAAERLNLPPKYAQDAEELATNSFLYSIAMSSMYGLPPDNLLLSEKLFFEESKIINELALSESCVIVGRCASYVLKDRNDVLNVFIYSDDKSRKERAINEYGISEKDVESMLKKSDKRRAQFYSTHSKLKWDGVETYDLCLNSGKIGIDLCVKTIENIIKEV